MENLLFLAVAALLWFAADGIVQTVEIRLGRRLEHRTLLFFALLLTFSLGSFAAIRQLLG